MEWKKISEEKPELNKIVLFFQPSTEKYFAGKLDKELIGTGLHNEGKEEYYDYWWCTATGHCKDMKNDDVWMEFPFYESFKIYK